MLKPSILITIIFCLLPLIATHKLTGKNSVGQKCTNDQDCQTGLKCNTLKGICFCGSNKIWSIKDKKCYSCPSGWFEYANGCYFASTQALDWQSAFDDCKKKKSQLLVVDSDTILDFTTDFFSNVSLVGPYFVGARTIGLPKNWTWLDNRKIPSSGMWWTECFEPSNTGPDPTNMRIFEGCATISLVGLNDVKCSNLQKYICENDMGNSKYFPNQFDYLQRYNLYGLKKDKVLDKYYRGNERVSVRFNGKCKYKYECLIGLDCINGTCSCPNNLVYSEFLNECISINGKEINIDKDKVIQINDESFTWYDANIEAFKLNSSLLMTDISTLMKVINYLSSAGLEGPFWIGGSVINGVNVLNDGTVIPNGPWFANFNCDQKNRKKQLVIEFIFCLAIFRYEIVILPCTEMHPFIIIFGLFLSFEIFCVQHKLKSINFSNKNLAEIVTKHLDLEFIKKIIEK